MLQIALDKPLWPASVGLELGFVLSFEVFPLA